MNNIERLAERYRVPVKRDECGDRIIRGRNGHLYVDAGQIMVCFTDDGRAKPFTPKLKTGRLKMLPEIRLTQAGDCEFIGQIPESLVWAALFRVLGVKRFKVTKGQPQPAHLATLERDESGRKRAGGGGMGSDTPGPTGDAFQTQEGPGDE